MTKEEIIKKLDSMFANSLDDLRRNVLAGRKYCADDYRHELSTIIRVAHNLGIIDYEQFEVLNRGIWRVYFEN